MVLQTRGCKGAMHFGSPGQVLQNLQTAQDPLKPLEFWPLTKIKTKMIQASQGLRFGWPTSFLLPVDGARDRACRAGGNFYEVAKANTLEALRFLLLVGVLVLLKVIF